MINKVLLNELALTEITLNYLKETGQVQNSDPSYFAKRFFETYNQIRGTLSQLQNEDANKHVGIR